MVTDLGPWQRWNQGAVGPRNDRSSAVLQFAIFGDIVIPYYVAYPSDQYVYIKFHNFSTRPGQFDLIGGGGQGRYYDAINSGRTVYVDDTPVN